MSAFIVSEKCMTDIIYNLYWDHEFKKWYSTLKNNGYNECEDFDRLYQELYIMNRNAVIQRYDEKEDSDYIKLPDVVNWNDGQLDKYQALKSMHCLRYQCSEGNVPETKLYKLLDEIIHDWESYIINRMPEYEKARWS